ncbi:MAG TPA: choice-of-anchor P family protein [Thermoanaerobaculia bacterium]|nr:choice-of-anchor P family protein [Thermoanaerobaculia bacterium]
MRQLQHHATPSRVPESLRSNRSAPPPPLCPVSLGRAAVLAAVALAFASALAPAAVHAQGTRGSSQAMSVSGWLKLVTFSGSGDSVDLGRVATVSAQAPPNYLLSDARPNFAANLGEAGKVLGSSTLRSAVAGTVEISQLLSARAEAEDLELIVVGAAPLLTLSVDGVVAEASMSGPCGDALRATGSVTIAGATVGGSLGLGLTIPLQPSADTVLLDRDGMRIVLHERKLTGSGFGDLRLVVNAIHVELDEVLIPGLGLLSGQIVIGHAEAGLICGDMLQN